MKNARKMDDEITIGWVPDADDLDQLKELGYRTIVDVREAGEKFGGRVQKAAEALGFDYINIAIARRAIRLEDVVRFCRVVYRKENAPLYVFSRFGKKPLALLMLFEAVARNEPLFRVFQRASRLGVDLRGDLPLQAFLVDMYNSEKHETLLELIREVRPEMVNGARREASLAQGRTPETIVEVEQVVEMSLIPHQKGCTVWLTGPPFAGKRTTALTLRHQLSDSGFLAYALDPDIALGDLRDNRVSKGSVEETRQVGRMARVLAHAGMIVATSAESPRREERALVRKMHLAEQLGFVEVYLDAAPEVLRRREAAVKVADEPHGNRKAGDVGKLIYEQPQEPALILQTDRRSPEQLATQIVWHLTQNGYLGQEPSLWQQTSRDEIRE